MIKNKFKLYLLFCVFMFFILTFIVLFYSFGYKYNPKQGKIIQTGAIILHAFPEEAEIYLNGQLIKKNSGLSSLFNNFVKIEGLEPKTYEISAKLKDFSSWEKKIKIESEHVIEFKNVVLVKSNPEKEIISKNIETSGDDNIWFNNNKKRAAYAKIQKNKLSLAVMNLESKEEKIYYSFEEIFQLKNSKNLSIRNIFWSDSDNKILIAARKDNKDFSALIDFSGNKIFRLTDNIYEKEIVRNFQFPDALYYIKDSSLFEGTFSAPKATIKKLLGNISAFLIENGSIYYIKSDNGFLYKNTFSSFNSESIVAELPKDFDSKIQSKIIRSANNFLILGLNKKLTLINDAGTTMKISTNADDASFFDNSNRIIYSNNNEIWLYYIKEKTSQPAKQSKTNELITRYSGNISNISLYRDNEHILYKEGYVLKFAELDERGGRNIFDVVSVKNNDIAYIPDDNSILYLENSSLTKSFLGNEVQSR